ncbi:hypothetical protein MMC26_006802 [Xylographa opegraphella]|nr:hypothetical protein [Xylographa opegraphella]
MSYLQNTTLLQSTRGHSTLDSKSTDQVPLGKQTNGSKSLRSRGSIAALVNLVRNPVATVGEAVENWYGGLTAEERARKQQLEDTTHIFYLRMRSATNYDDWKAAATKLDELEGNNAWKTVVESAEYDDRLVEARLRQLDEARISCDVGRMLFLIRTALARGLGNMGNLHLYKHTHIGTKDLIERYITSALETLDALLDISAKAKCDRLETKHILEQVLSSRQAFGRSALLLSGGATFGMNHIGVLKALWETHLLPRIISGASAGSIVCAVLCTRTDEEMPDLLAGFCHGDLAVFEEEGNEDGLMQKIVRFLKFGALFDISHLTRVMKDMLGDLTFQEGYNRTRRILNICVSSASLYELPRLLNYVTAPNVLIWSAVAASCSVPLLFSAASLLAKDPRTGEAVPWNPSPQQWIDGSVDNDLPMTRLAEMFNVNHFIVSQVNPHVVPFLIKEEDTIAREAQQSTASLAAAPTWVHSMTHFAKGEALHRMHMMSEMGIFPNTLTKAVSVLSQKYSGDITIFPEISYADFPRMLSNPTPEFMERAMLCGQRATWPKLSRIRNHCAIELALDDAVQKLRTRVVFSTSQADLRLRAYVRSNSDSKSRRSLDDARGGRSRRKMSQNSEIAAEVRSFRDGRTKVQNAASSNNVLGPNTHPSDLNRAKYTIPDRSALQRLSTELKSSPFFQPYPTYDIVSSGAETSNLSTSDYDTDVSSPMDSPYSSTSPAIPELWPDSRQLFPHATQPNTPAGDLYRSAIWSPLANASPCVSGHSRSPSASKKSLSMTPGDEVATSTIPSSPEQKYKRLFHNAKSRLKAISPVQPSHPTPAPNTGVKRFSSIGLEIDMSGTRGMVLRKKSRD